MKTIISWIIRHVPRTYLQRVSHFILPVLGLFYKGNQVVCPICQGHFRKFLPFGRGKSARDNALCPNCLALERHRLMYLYLKQRTNFFQDKLKVLHIAPEICFLKHFEKLPNLQEYITADLESPLAKVKMDIHQMPFADNYFDVVFCNHVLEHVENDKQALSEIYRVMKPTAWAIIQSPIDMSLPTTYEDHNITSPAEREKAFGQNDHVRIYGRDYSKHLAQIGFQVKEDDFVKQLPKEVIEKHALPANEIIFLCKK
ncbi:MAG: class I SAM-dependent methyltransferase [Microscillaceae bacterium]|nr:class I SAM-dependent methyltransferase [Microscillaceae bacterium]MDW8460281.1 class I SAM-dependent methyltransferase [Cytophagales bacterium]